ncbi:MAG TPA: GGDEF domain-containing protein [Spirochaetota bacterium]|nr:GGDEF domain-containing protein [Spirochaetota bacterium]HPJ35657.1 GGDEF domain-containing protein [Spirochaetota bacterium]
MHIDKKNWLRRAEVFAALNERELELIEGYTGICSFKEGDLLIQEGERGGVLHIVVSGSVQAVKTDKWEGDTLIAELVEGDILGELEFFTGAKFNNSVKAVSDVTLLRVPGEDMDFGDILEAHPDISAEMLYRFLKVFSNRLRKANVLVKDNSALVQELKRQVYGDKLTGLYNKTYLEETLPGILKKRTGPVGLLLMKPDNFKMINDTFGHEAGDDTLKIMAASLNRFMDGRGTVLRYMGNELGVILENHGRDEAYGVAGEILKMFNELDISGATGSKEVFLSMSIGVAVYPDHANIADELILKAHDLPLVGRERGGNMILFPEDAGN